MRKEHEERTDNLIILRIKSLDLVGVKPEERIPVPEHRRVYGEQAYEMICSSKHGRVIEEPARGLMVICESCDMFWQ